MHDYPTLSLIDRALGIRDHGFVNDPDAAHLERRARQLAAEYWSDTVWLTGLVPMAALRTVCSALEHARRTNGVGATPRVAAVQKSASGSVS